MVRMPGVRMYFCSSSTRFHLVACYETHSNRLGYSETKQVGNCDMRRLVLTEYHSIFRDDVVIVNGT